MNRSALNKGRLGRRDDLIQKGLQTISKNLENNLVVEGFSNLRTRSYNGMVKFLKEIIISEKEWTK